MRLRDMQDEVEQWLDGVIPERTTKSVLIKLEEERQELLDTLQDTKHIDPTEFADLLIIILDLASLNCIDVQSSFKKKMNINRSRRWEVDENGCAQHIKCEKKGIKTKEKEFGGGNKN